MSRFEHLDTGDYRKGPVFGRGPYIYANMDKKGRG